MHHHTRSNNTHDSINLIFVPYKFKIIFNTPIPLSHFISPPPFIHSLRFSIARPSDFYRIGPDMAQKREKEETEIKVPESLPICTPPHPISTTTLHVPASRTTEGSDPKTPRACDSRLSSGLAPESPDQVEKRVMKRPREVNRCAGSGCRKRIGLMGFRCRCGEVFCSEHRYSDRHDCSYDYKAAGREAISRENPVIRAAKILKV